MTFLPIGPFLVRQGVSFGPWFPVHRAYSYGLVVTALALLLLQIFRSLHFYRVQAILVFSGMLLAFGANAIANSFLSPTAAELSPWLLDWTVPGFTITCLAWSWALLRVPFLDVMPVALDAVFGCMNDAVIVLDRDGRIVDLNPAGGRLIGHARTAAVGAPFAVASPDLAAAVARRAAGEPRDEIAMGERTVELRVSSLRGPRVERLAGAAEMFELDDLAAARASRSCVSLPDDLGQVGVGLLRARPHG